MIVKSNKEISCKFSIKNIGDIAGAETAQCYVGFLDPSEEEPNKTLQGFTKIDIDANESKDVEIKLIQRNFSHWSVDTNTWQIKGGSYQIYIGSSSQNISLKSMLNLEPVLEVL